MKHKFFSMILAALVAVAPLFAQGTANKNEDAEAKTGVRFVNCSSSGVQIPSPLFVRSGKTVQQLNITSRVPSPRVKPTNGVINLYDKDPSIGSGDKGKPDPTLQPVITIQVPAEMASGKTLCILMPNDRSNPSKVSPMFIKESAFPKNGVHIINLSPNPLQMKTSVKGDYTDAVVKNIAAYKGSLAGDNVWSSPQGEDGAQLAFILSAHVKNSKEPRRIKASRFAVSSRQAQINLVVKDPTRESFKLLSIQLTD